MTAFGLGTVCHLGPGNVPINAPYSWVKVTGVATQISLNICQLPSSEEVINEIQTNKFK